MNDELLIISPLDQNLDVADDDQILEKIERMILDSIAEKDVHKALSICKQVYKIALLSGKALAQVLYLMKIHWEEFGVGDDFYDVMVSATGLSKHTVQTYPEVHALQAENKIPEAYRDDIMKKNIKNLVPIAQALNAGYEIDDDEWEELVDAPDFSTVNAKLREIKGKEPRSHALILMMDREGGIRAIKGDVQIYIGFLNTSEENEVAQQAIQRLIKGAGILLQ